MQGSNATQKVCSEFVLNEIIPLCGRNIALHNNSKDYKCSFVNL